MREALRGPREVLELWASERAVRSEAWLREVERPRVQTKLERDLSEAAGTRDHQGVVAWCEPFRYADAFELAAGQSPLLACLDQVSDPRNLGAVIRSAEGAGASGVVVPAHGSAQRYGCRLPLLGRGGGAPSGRRCAEPRPLPRRDQERHAVDRRCGGRVGNADVESRPIRRHRLRLRGRGERPASTRAAHLRP